MNALRPINLGPSLSDVCPEFRDKIREYARLATRDPQVAERVFREAQEIARVFRMKGRAA